MSQVISLHRVRCKRCKRCIKGVLNDLFEILAMQGFTDKEKSDLLRIIALLANLNKQLNKEKTDVKNI